MKELILHIQRNSKDVPATEFGINHIFFNACYSFDIKQTKRLSKSANNEIFLLNNDFEIYIRAKDLATSKEDILNEIKQNIKEYDVVSCTDLNTGEHEFLQYEHPTFALENFKLEDNDSLEENALKLFPNVIEAATNFSTLGKMYFEQTQYFEALIFYKKAYQLYKRNNNNSIHDSDVATSLYCISSCAFRLNNLISAIRYLEMACLIIQNKEGIKNAQKAKYYEKLSTLLSNYGKYNAAIKWLDKTSQLNSLSEPDKNRIQEEKHRLQLIAVDRFPDYKPNPFGVSGHQTSSLGELFQTDVTQTTTDPHQRVIGLEGFRLLNMFCKPLDPSKWDALLDTLLEATRQQNLLKFHRLLQLVPHERKKEVYDHLKANGIVNTKREDSSSLQRPFNVEDSYFLDPMVSLETVHFKL